MPEPAWLDPSEAAAWHAVVVTHGRLFARLDDELVRAHGLSLAEYEVLLQLVDAGCAGLRMSELAERALVSRSGLTRRVDAMVEAGLVCRRPCPSDRRGTLAVVTEAGRARLEEAAPTHVAGVHRHLLDRLSREEMVVLSTALDRVAEALGGYQGSCAPGPGYTPTGSERTESRAPRDRARAGGEACPGTSPSPSSSSKAAAASARSSGPTGP